MTSNFATKNVFAALVAEREDEEEKGETEPEDVSEDEDEKELGTWWQVDDDDVDSSDVSGFISTEWSIDEAGNG